MSDLALPSGMAMRERQGVVWLEAPMGAARAIFTTRIGGVSSPPRDTLNLAPHVEPDIDLAYHNRSRLCGAAGMGPESVVLCRQVHGRAIFEVGAAVVGGEHPEADGLLRVGLGRSLVVQVADCAAVVIAEPSSGIGAVVHAGWRGAAAGIIEEAAARVARASGQPASELRAAIGPCARGCCYEVGAEVRASFTLPEDAAVFAPGREDRFLFDLGLGILGRLEVAGLSRRNVQDASACTICRGDLFFSYRRDGYATGRMWGCLADAEASPRL